MKLTLYHGDLILFPKIDPGCSVISTGSFVFVSKMRFATSNLDSSDKLQKAWDPSIKYAFWEYLPEYLSDLLFSTSAFQAPIFSFSFDSG